MPFRVLAAPAATKAEHGVRSRVLISASDAKALKLSSGDAVIVQDGLVCTVGILNTIKPQTCMLSSEVLDKFPSGTQVALAPITELIVCTELHLSPSTQFTPSTLNYLARRWQDCVVSPGTKLGAFMAGNFRVFCVEHVEGGNTIGPHTKVVTWFGEGEGSKAKSSVLAAGLEVEKARLVDLIETWQLHTTMGEQSKFPPPRSAIIFGSSGCGKTLLAKQIQQHFGSDKVMFWDDADLAEEEDGEVVNVANRFLLATCSAASVPEQTRKRFDVELEIAPPNAYQRAQILTALLASHQSNAIDVGKVANGAHGFVGADLNLLVKQALTREGEITLDALLKAVKSVKPSCLREAVVTIPNVRWDDIGGMDEVKNTIRESVELPLKHPQAFERLGIRPPNGILLYGPPGCSKTLLAKAVATESEMNFIAVKGPELLSKWVGDSEKAIQATFRRARMSKPCVVFFDEIDALAVQRSADGGGVSHRVTSQLLQELDGIEPRNGVIVLCATNRPDLLDVALLRPGRIDRLVYVPPPDLPARLEILKINLAPIPHSFPVDLLAGLDTRGFSGAEVASICRNAALLALEQDCSEVSFAHLELVTAKVQPQITQSVLDFYAEFKRRLR
ncbi:hypothetical protein BASA81_001607 [Batrachochytrium salamandrivorans]|nr:hypothetical protein BASA81_001607 [Batrachochytrium salamandrivorans]